MGSEPAVPESPAPDLAPAPSPALSPVGPGERVLLLDGLRGFAIFGILFANIDVMAFPEGYPRIGQELFPGGLDESVRWFVRFAVEGKFYTLFSVLFGAGLAIQAERATAAGRSFGWATLRRLLVLLVLALAHDVLIWNGRILLAYATIGLLCIPFRRARARTLLIWAAVLIALPCAGMGVRALLVRPPAEALAAMDPEELQARRAERAERQRAAFDEELALGREGRYTELVAHRTRLLPRALRSIAMFFTYMLALFLLGMACWRTGLFARDGVRKRWLWFLLIAGLAIGLVGNAAFHLGRPWLGPSAMIGFMLGNPAQCLAYVAAFALLARTGLGAALLRLLAPVGRTALSNYVLQSVLGTLFFAGYGLGQYGAWSPAQCMLLLPGFFAIQLGLSHLWLRRFRYGPLEWLWRTLSYGRTPGHHQGS